MRNIPRSTSLVRLVINKTDNEPGEPPVELIANNEVVTDYIYPLSGRDDIGDGKVFIRVYEVPKNAKITLRRADTKDPVDITAAFDGVHDYGSDLWTPPYEWVLAYPFLIVISCSESTEPPEEEEP